MRSLVSGTIASYGLKKRAEPVVNCRKISKRDMKHNDSLPAMEGESCIAGRHVWSPKTQRHVQFSTVDPETYEVHADGVLCDAPPATKVALGKTEFVF